MNETRAASAAEKRSRRQKAFWQNTRISQLDLKQIDNDEDMRANGRAHANIEIRVYVSKRAKYCECKGKEHGHAVEITLTHTYTFGCYESKLNAIKGKTIMKLRKEGNSIHDKRKY